MATKNKRIKPNEASKERPPNISLICEFLNFLFDPASPIINGNQTIKEIPRYLQAYMFMLKNCIDDKGMKIALIAQTLTDHMNYNRGRVAPLYLKEAARKGGRADKKNRWVPIVIRDILQRINKVSPRMAWQFLKREYPQGNSLKFREYQIHFYDGVDETDGFLVQEGDFSKKSSLKYKTFEKYFYRILATDRPRDTHLVGGLNLNKDYDEKAVAKNKRIKSNRASKGQAQSISLSDELLNLVTKTSELLVRREPNQISKNKEGFKLLQHHARLLGKYILEKDVKKAMTTQTLLDHAMYNLGLARPLYLQNAARSGGRADKRKKGIYLAIKEVLPRIKKKSPRMAWNFFKREFSWENKLEIGEYQIYFDKGINESDDEFLFQEDDFNKMSSIKYKTFEKYFYQVKKENP